MQLPPRIFRGWTGGLGLLLLLAALALALDASWLGWHDGVDFTVWRREQLATLATQRAALQREWDGAQARLDRLKVGISSTEERVRQTDKVIGELRQLVSTWERLVGNPEQQRANAEQLDRLTKSRAESSAQVAEFQQESKRTRWERDGLEITRASLDARLAAISNDRTTVGHYLTLAWRRMKFPINGVLVVYGLGCAIFYLRRRHLHAGPAG